MAASNTTQRLIRELKEYHKTPNESLLHLGPVDEEDLLHWEAVLKGVDGTPYEGKSSARLWTIKHQSRGLLFVVFIQTNDTRRPLAPSHRNPSELPPRTTDHPLHDEDLASEHLFHQWRNLPHAPDDRALESCLYAFVDADCHPAAADGPAA